MAYKAYINNTIFFSTDAVSDDLKLSEARLELQAGASGLFTFVVPPDNRAYESFDKLVDYIEVFRDDDLIFSGRIYSIEKIFDTQQKVTCEGMLAVFNDSIFRPITFSGFLHDLVRELVANHNSQVETRKEILVGNLLVSDSQVYRAYEKYETTISRLQDLATTFGGFFAIRKDGGSFYLDWHASYDQGNTQSIDFGSNLIDLRTEDDASRIVTVLIPLGTRNDDGTRLTIKSVNSGEDYIEASEEYIQKYGYVVGSQIWDDVTVASILKTKGQNWMNACLTPAMTIEVTAVDLADAGYDVGQFIVGQKLKVTSLPHGITGQWFDCTEQTLDLLHPEQNRLVLGTEQIGFVNAQRSLSTEIQYSIEKITRTYTPRSALQTAIDTATAMITGNSGGYVVLHDSDDDGYPDELLIMDTPDINTAVKVWRFNNAGLGYSSTGYDGTYGLAMTMDGAIVADRITTGTLNGNLIRAGIIRGQQGNTYWDLNTGVLHIEGSGDIDKSKTFIYEPVPPYYIGDLWCTQRSETSGVVGYAIAGYAVVGDDSDGEGGKIMACIYTRTSGSFNPDDWTLITNYIDDSDIQIIEQRISSAEININANAAEIQTKASMEIVDDLGDRLATAETTITQNSHDIELKVTESDITGNYVIGKINLSSTTAAIAASHIDLQGAVTISSFDSTAKAQIVTGATSQNQYYLSTSSSSLSGGTWSNSVNWISGRYIWTRIATVKTYADNTTSTSYSDAIYDSNLTSALSTATTANATANGAVGSTVSCYYRSTSSTTPTISTSTSIGTSATTDNAWEYVLPRPKQGCYFFTCERYTYRDGTVGFSTVRQMSNLTYTSLWCSANDASYIDGGHIYASSVTATQIASSAITTAKLDAGAVTTAKIAANAVTAAKINVADLFSQNITATNFNMTGGTINVTSSWSVNDDIIQLNYGSWYSKFSPKGFNSYDADFYHYASLWATSLTFKYGNDRAYFGLSSAHRGSLWINNGEAMCVSLGQASGYNGYINVSNGYGTTTITATGNNGSVTAASFDTTSDRNAKCDIETLDVKKCAETVYKMPVSSFQYKNMLGETHHGIIAQDAETVLKDVYGETDWALVKTPTAEGEEKTTQYKSLSYTELIADLIAVAQLHNKRLEALEQR